MFLGTLTDEDRVLVNRIFLEYNERFYYLALRMMRNENDAQDAVAQTFLKIAENVDKIRNMTEIDIARYCVTIARNASMDIFRYRKKVTSFDEVDDPELELSSNVERQFLESEEQRRLVKVTKRLSEEDRYLIQLRYVYRLSYRDIARVLDVGEEATRKRGQRVLKRLRALYEEEESGGR